LVTGLDLVKMQIHIAAGERLPLTQDKVEFRGHAIECRINAEDPDNNFLPSPGTIEQYVLPGGPNVRVDSHGYVGYRIPPYYDSLIAKFIAHGRNRMEAIQIMLRMLRESSIGPIKTTIPLHEKILNRPRYRQGGVSTNFIDVHVMGEKNENSKEKAG